MFSFQVCFILLVRGIRCSVAYDLAIYVETFITPNVRISHCCVSFIFNFVFQQWIKNPARRPGPNQQEDIRQSQAGDMAEDMHMSVSNRV